MRLPLALAPAQRRHGLNEIYGRRRKKEAVSNHLKLQLSAHRPKQPLVSRPTSLGALFIPMKIFELVSAHN